LEQGQRVQPLKRNQPPARSQIRGRKQQAQRGAVNANGIPSNPIDFLAQKIGGGYQPKMGVSGHTRNDYRAWLPLLEMIAKSPGASGVLVQAYITRLNNMMNGPVINEHTLIDQNEADDELELLLNGGR